MFSDYANDDISAITEYSGERIENIKRVLSGFSHFAVCHVCVELWFMPSGAS